MRAVAKYASGGKPTAKKDLGLMAMRYGNVYVAQAAMGANDIHTLKSFIEAESHDGPSLIIAYSHCLRITNRRTRDEYANGVFGYGA